MPRSSKPLQIAPEWSAEPSQQITSAPRSIDAAALARITFSANRQPLAIPRLAGAPANYTHTSDVAVSLQIYEDLVNIGLGSLALWRKHNGNPLAFATEALNLWLQKKGAKELTNRVNFSLSLTGEIEGVQEPGFAFATIHAVNFGYLELGLALAALDREQAGLGAAFYHTLMAAMHGWMETYDYRSAELSAEMQKESIEASLEEGCSFEQFCIKEGIDFPDIDCGVPECVRTSSPSEAAAVDLLEANATGPFAVWIGFVLQARRSQSKHQLNRHDCSYEWDDAPLPSWLVAMSAQDGIVQCFDDDFESMHEGSREPTCIFRYRLGDHEALRNVLEDIAQFVSVNRAVAQLAESTAKWSEGYECKRERGRVA